jgi:Ca2+-binding EF-hand superfamily protein
LPEILCPKCLEGATTLTRDRTGFIALFIASGIILLLVLWVHFKRRNQLFLVQLLDMQELSTVSVVNAINYRSRKKQLQALKPKLAVIETRVKKGKNIDANIISTDTVAGDIVFDAKKMFNLLDTNGDGTLSYQELNEVLQLKPVALREFANRMNKEGQEPAGTTTISRRVFVKFFLSALEASSHFEPTPQEAAQLYDEIAAHTVTVDGNIPLNNFYYSVLTDFLTDTEIHDLLLRFRVAQDVNDGDNEQLGGMRGSAMKNPNHRMSARMSSMFSIHQTVHTISRNEFIARYPALLLEVTNQAVKKSVKTEKDGIDLAFENLSLSLNVKAKPIKVVNDVSGRLRAGTMTALSKYLVRCPVAHMERRKCTKTSWFWALPQWVGQEQARPVCLMHCAAEHSMVRLQEPLKSTVKPVLLKSMPPALASCHR